MIKEEGRPVQGLLGRNVLSRKTSGPGGGEGAEPNRRDMKDSPGLSAAVREVGGGLWNGSTHDRRPRSERPVLSGELDRKRNRRGIKEIKVTSINWEG